VVKVWKEKEVNVWCRDKKKGGLETRSVQGQGELTVGKRMIN
jgi:hypothetical protein